MVGPSGLEPPTSCLSGTRSNLLSYDPSWLVKWFFTWNGGDDGDSRAVRLRLLCSQLLFAIAPMRISALCSKLAPTSNGTYLVPLGRNSSHGGDDGIRTHDPLLAGQVLSQLSYTPIKGFAFSTFSIRRTDLSVLLTVSALSYLPVQSPVKYCRHCRA